MRCLSQSVSFLFCLVMMTTACNQQKVHEMLDVKGIDSSIKPGDDFFEYVNAKWDKNATIPLTESGAGAFFDLQKQSEEALKKVCEQAAATKNPAKGSLEQMVGDLYASAMDTNALEAKGLTPIQSAFDAIYKIASHTDMLRFVATEQVNGNNLLFGFGVGADDKNAFMNIASYIQGGLGLPDRDYYFRSDPGTIAIRNGYLNYLKKIFVLSGDDSTAALRNAQTVLAVETKLAEGHFTSVELRNPEKNYNKFSIAELNKLTPAIDWDQLTKNMLLDADTVLIGQPKFFVTLDKLCKTVPVEDWKLYLKAFSIGNASSSLTKAIREASFDFYGKMLSGQEQPKPRWQYAVGVVDGRIGDLSGQLYVKDNFDQRAKNKMMEMIDNLQISFENHIKALDWMSDSTKKQALDKLEAVMRKIGFPDKWKNYAGLDISRDDYFQNRINTSKHAYMRMVAKNGKPVDKTEWPFTPPTVNAYYSPTNNEILFLAGILQPPFFHPDADDATNYGAIGMVIGHEFTHGFDDQGRQYDKNGNLKEWWTKSDAEKFGEKAKKVVTQYGNYIPVDSLHINGELTLGENIADIGGLAVAYDAFKMTKQAKEAKLINGLTPDQRFFLSFANIWRLKLKPELLRQLVLTDVHSPAKYRVNGPLSNFTPFYEAFQVQKGDKMWKETSERIKIW